MGGEFSPRTKNRLAQTRLPLPSTARVSERMFAMSMQSFESDEFWALEKDLKHIASLTWAGGPFCRHQFWLSR